MARCDPSEAVRSDEILRLLPRYFEIIERHDQGGSVLHVLLDRIAGNFDPTQPEDVMWLELLFRVEDLGIQYGELASDFAVVICQRPVSR